MTELLITRTSVSKAPSHAAYHVRDRKEGEAIWTRIGSAWQHADGKGLNLQIETVPLDGRISSPHPVREGRADPTGRAVRPALFTLLYQ